MRCDECQWWDTTTVEAERGYCRKYAPRPCIHNFDEREYVDWPEVGKSNWCGEFKAKEDPDERMR